MVDSPEPKTEKAPWEILRAVVELCADCDTCRFLMAEARKLDPQAIITDCMSCRLQFRHALPYPVFHPLEIRPGPARQGMPALAWSGRARGAPCARSDS